MSHAQSLFYLRLFSNALMGCALGIVFPYTLLSTARTLRYAQNPSARTWVRMAVWWLGIVALSYVFGIINTNLGPWSSEVIQVYLQVTAAVFTLTFGIYCWLHAGALKSLYPKEDFIIEQEKRRLLLAKLQACDETMPLARFESRHGQIIWANRTAQELLGYSLQQLHRLPAGSLCHPDDRERVLRNALEQSGVPYECRIVTATDRVVHVEVRTTNDPSDTALRISFLTDVTRYVEERDRRIREYNSYQSLKNRRSAEDGLLADLVEGSNNF